MTWVWLSSPAADFGRGRAARSGERRTVWLHADPFGALGLHRAADPDAVRRAYLRLARAHHPDVAGRPESAARFQEVQDAARAVAGEADVGVEPIAGEWWRFVGFTRPDPRVEDFAVAGLTFELRDLTR